MLPILQLVKSPYLAFCVLTGEPSIATLIEQEWIHLTPYEALIDMYDHINTLPTATAIWREHMNGILRYCKKQTAMVKKKRDIVVIYVRFMQVFLCQYSHNGVRLDQDILSDWCKDMKEKKPFIRELKSLALSYVTGSRREFYG